jgi:hypothetical protein
MSGCAPQITTFSFYDSCSGDTKSFSEMVSCGKAKRTAYCAEHSVCTADGTAVVQYADSLQTSVQTGEISAAEAQRKWVEFRMTQLNARRQAAATAAASSTTCYKSGNIMNCY